MADALLAFAVRGRMEPLLRAQAEAIPRARTAVVRSRTLALKKSLRGQVIHAGLGNRLAKALQSALQPPRGIADNPAGAVFSKAIYKDRPGGRVDLLTVFQEGAVIRARGGKALAIPTAKCPRSKDGRKRFAVPADFPRDLLFVSKSGRTLFIKGDPPIPAWTLVPQVSIKRRLNFLIPYRRHTANMDAAVVKRIEQDAKRIGRQAARA